MDATAASVDFSVDCASPSFDASRSGARNASFLGSANASMATDMPSFLSTRSLNDSAGGAVPRREGLVVPRAAVGTGASRRGAAVAPPLAPGAPSITQLLEGEAPAVRAFHSRPPAPASSFEYEYDVAGPQEEEDGEGESLDGSVRTVPVPDYPADVPQGQQQQEEECGSVASGSARSVEVPSYPLALSPRARGPFRPGGIAKVRTRAPPPAVSAPSPRHAEAGAAPRPAPLSARRGPARPASAAVPSPASARAPPSYSRVPVPRTILLRSAPLAAGGDSGSTGKAGSLRAPAFDLDALYDAEYGRGLSPAAPTGASSWLLEGSSPPRTAPRGPRMVGGLVSPSSAPATPSSPPAKGAAARKALDPVHSWLANAGYASPYASPLRPGAKVARGAQPGVGVSTVRY
jgi:hypothetical protein